MCPWLHRRPRACSSMRTWYTTHSNASSWLYMCIGGSSGCCCCIRRLPLLPCRFTLAEVHMADLASKADLLRYVRQQLCTLMQQGIADSASALGDKTDILLAGCQRLVTLLPNYRAVPKLEGIGAKLHSTCVVAVIHHICCHVPVRMATS